MSYTIAITSYLNTRPLLYHRPLPGCKILALPPAMTVNALLNGDIDAGIVPVAGLHLLANRTQLLGPYGITSQGRVLSVALFSKLPFEAFNQRHGVLLSPESMTSNQLLFLLFGARAGAEKPPKVVTAAPAEGELVIGDNALLRYYQGRDNFITDLPEKWQELTGQAFVFARWVIRKNAPHALKQRLLDWLAEFKDNETGLRLQTAEQERLNFRPLGEAQILDYLKRIHCFIGAPEQQSQALFLDCVKRLPAGQTLSASNPPLLLQAS